MEKGHYIEEDICEEIRYNPNMGWECISKTIIKGYSTIFYIDETGNIEIGDKIKIEKNAQNFNVRVWVNNKLIWQKENN